MSKTGNVSNSYLYAGYQYDEETGLYYLNARMYDSETARFIQEDTYRGNPNDPLSLNLYTYCENNPLIYNDPTGHWPEFVNKAVKTVKQAVKKVTTKVKSVTKNVLNNTKTKVSQVVKGVAGSNNKGASSGAKSMTAIKSTLKGGLKTVVGLKELPFAISGAFIEIGRALKQMPAKVIEAVSEEVSGAWKFAHESGVFGKSSSTRLDEVKNTLGGFGFVNDIASSLARNDALKKANNALSKTIGFSTIIVNTIPGVIENIKSNETLGKTLGDATVDIVSTGVSLGAGAIVGGAIGGAIGGVPGAVAGGLAGAIVSGATYMSYNFIGKSFVNSFRK